MMEQVLKDKDQKQVEDLETAAEKTHLKTVLMAHEDEEWDVQIDQLAEVKGAVNKYVSTTTTAPTYSFLTKCHIL